MWIQLNDGERSLIRESLGHINITEAKALRLRMDDHEPSPYDEYYLEAARSQLSDPDEIDPDGFISFSDEGAYVMAWVWVNHPFVDAPMQSWAPEVQTDQTSKWYGNSLRFATQEEAEASVAELASRWFAVHSVRTVESADPVNYRFVENRLIPLQEEA
jgi:hypothetical protein